MSSTSPAPPSPVGNLASGVAVRVYLSHSLLPCIDPTVLDLQLRAIAKTTTSKPVVVKQVEDAEHNPKVGKREERPR